MKANLHPTNYRLVVFQDLNNDSKFLMKSTIATQETIQWEDGQTYPLVKLHVTSASHPYYTGVEKVIDIEGRIDKFRARQNIAQANQDKIKAKIHKITSKDKQAQVEVDKLEIKPKDLQKTPSEANLKDTEVPVDDNQQASDSDS